MRRSPRFLLLIVMLGLTIAASLVPGLVTAQVDNQDPGSGSGGGCSYCSQTACGCLPPGEGMTLSFWCVCSQIQCQRSCSYH